MKSTTWGLKETRKDSSSLRSLISGRHRGNTTRLEQGGNASKRGTLQKLKERKLCYPKETQTGAVQGGLLGEGGKTSKEFISKKKVKKKQPKGESAGSLVLFEPLPKRTTEFRSYTTQQDRHPGPFNG